MEDHNNKVLFVDDESDLLVSYELILRKNFNVHTAESGEEGIKKIEDDGPFATVVADYNMPGMNGIEFLSEVKKLSPYSVRIILTSSDDVRTAADAVNETNIFRFLTKPITHEKLRLAIDASVEQYRLIMAEQELNRKLKEAYEQIKEDLRAAARVQQHLLPKKNLDLSGISFDAIFIPSEFLSGDNYSYFKLDSNHIGFYLLDVSGHGIPAAMNSFALSNYLTTNTQKDTPLMVYDNELSDYKIIPPDKVLEKLNERFMTSGRNINYFTMVYGVINLTKRTLSIVHAAHPPSFLIKSSGEVKTLGARNFPLGVFPDAEFRTEYYDVEPGDRLLIYSDGVTECKNQEGELFSENRLEEFLVNNKSNPSQDIIKDLENTLRNWHVEESFQDDLTFFIVEFSG